MFSDHFNHHMNWVCYFISKYIFFIDQQEDSLLSSGDESSIFILGSKNSVSFYVAFYIIHFLRLRHDATNRGNTSPRLHCCCNKLLALGLSLRYVTQIQTSLNSCDRSHRQNSVAATMIFTCNTSRFVAATCHGNVSQRFVASRVWAFKIIKSRPYVSTKEATVWVHMCGVWLIPPRPLGDLNKYSYTI